jgi:hypothetical protein
VVSLQVRESAGVDFEWKIPLTKHCVFVMMRGNEGYLFAFEALHLSFVSTTFNKMSKFCFWFVCSVVMIVCLVVCLCVWIGDCLRWCAGDALL